MAEVKKDVTEKKTASEKEKDIEENKVLAMLSYIGILFIVPLLAAPKSKYAKFHANQGCALFIVEVGLSIIWIVPILGWLIGFFGGIFTLVLAIMGIVNALNGKEEKLPLIGNIVIIK